MRNTVSRGTRLGAAVLLVAGLAAVTPATATQAASSAAGSARCPDVRLVWAGGEGVGVVRSGFADRITVRTSVVSRPRPRLKAQDWPAVEEQGLGHPYFARADRAARAAISVMRTSVARCPSTPLVLGGHSDGAVAARLVLRRLGGPAHRGVRSRLTRVALVGDPAVEPRQRVEVDRSGREAAGVLAGRRTRLPGWVRRQALVEEECLFRDSFCDPGGDAPAPGLHYGYTKKAYRGGWPASLVSGAVLPRRLGAVMLRRGDALDGPALDLPELRMRPVRRLPQGLRIQRRSTGDRIVGRPRPGRSRVVVRAHAVGKAGALARRLTIAVRAKRPGARRGTVLVTRGVDGRPADGQSFAPLVSAAGSTVGFTSAATNLVRQRLGRGAHVFVWDRTSRRHELVGILPDGSAVAGEVRDISADGRRVLFSVTSAQSGQVTLWLRDRDRRTTVPVPADAQLDLAGAVVTYPQPEAGWTYTGAASADARYVVLARTEPPRGASTWSAPLRVWDNQSATVVRTGEFQMTDDGLGQYPDKLSADGRYLVLSGRPAAVVDLADGRVVASGSGVVDVSDDGRSSLRAGYSSRGRLSMRLGPVAGSGAVNLLPGAPHVFDVDDPFAGATVSTKGTAVAYGLDAELVVGQDRSAGRQIYHWRAR